MYEQTETLLTYLKQEKPLILNITNFVTMDLVANGLLSLGASPVMSMASEDVIELLPLCKALVINIGTLDDAFIALCHTACQHANQLNIPIVLDPVGAGATRYRTNTCLSLLEQYRFAIIRGNGSEIMSLANLAHHTKGVDSRDESIRAIDSGKKVAEENNTTVVISGETDYVIHREQHTVLTSGSACMPLITGSGCLLTAIIAAFHASEKNAYNAAILATLFYGLCGEQAERRNSAPGSFRAALLDSLHHLPNRGDYDKISSSMRVDYCGN